MSSTPPSAEEIHEMLIRAHNVFHLMMDEDIDAVREEIDTAVHAHGPIWLWYAIVHWADTFVTAMARNGLRMDGNDLRFTVGNGAVPEHAADPGRLLTVEQVEPAVVQAAEWILARAENDESKGRMMFRALIDAGDDVTMKWLNGILIMCAANSRSLGGCPL